jgi:rhodanese-related sulfurtransferase
MPLGCPLLKKGAFFLKRFLALLLILIPTLLTAGQISMVCHNELASWIKAGQALSIVDIQDSDGYLAHNYAGSFATGNDPLRLKKIASRLRSTKGKVIVVSAAGGNEAVQATEQLVREGVQRSRILLLEGGMKAAAKNAACECCKPSSIRDVAK